MLSDVQEARAKALPGHGAFYSGLLKGALLHDLETVKLCTEYNPDDWIKLSLGEIRTICMACECDVCKTKELVQATY
ncbi:MAG: hypothetical protein ACFFB3_07590 [Candidatus Hodarchaeota archaeon]